MNLKNHGIGYMIRFLILVSFLFFTQCKDFSFGSSSPVIETIGGRKITVKSFEDTYNVALESFAKSQGVEKSVLVDYLKKDPSEVPEQLKQVIAQFNKKNFYENYRQLIINTIALEKTNFHERDDVKSMSEYLRMQTISQLYIMEQIEKKIKISDQEIEDECKYLRSQSREIAALPVDRCQSMAKSRIKNNKFQENFPKVIERIKEEVNIKHNDDFNLDNYLNSNE
jgi:hypothetical protein